MEKCPVKPAAGREIQACLGRMSGQLLDRIARHDPNSRTCLTAF
jgi:hypothetical protein